MKGLLMGLGVMFFIWGVFPMGLAVLIEYAPPWVGLLVMGVPFSLVALLLFGFFDPK